MKLSRQNKIIVGIVALVLALTVGYALFSQSLNIGGTASAKGEFKLIFADASESGNAPSCVGFSGTCEISSLSSITEEGKTLTITVDKLNYPGAYVQIPAVIKNEGTVDAKLTGITTEGLSNDDIEVTYTGVVQGDVFTANSSKDITITVKWKESSESTSSLDFNIVLNYEQAAGTSSSEGTGGGSESGDTSWEFKVDSSGTLTAYNYNYGTDIQVPAEVDGIPVTTINENTFLPKGNVDAFQDESTGKMYVIIDEEGENFTNVKEKLVTMFTSECGEDSSCIENTKSVLYTCTDKNTCYNVLEEENGTATVTSIPDGAQSGGGATVVPDPNVSLEESFIEPKANITSLDLSAATNLTTIEDSAFNSVGLTSVNFGDNSNLQTIGNYAFGNNQLSGELVIPASVVTIGDGAFSGNNVEKLVVSGDVSTENLTLKQKGYTIEKLSTTTQKLASTTSSKLTTIGNYAFQNNQINSLDLSNATSLTTIAEGVFRGNQISSLKIPTGVTSIGYSAFQNNQISNLTIPSSVTTIGDSAFYNNKINSLTIPTGVTSIGYFAFQNNQISILTIPKTVTSLGSGAFSNNPIETLSIEMCTTDLCSYNSFGTQINDLTVESGEIGDSAFASASDSTTKIANLTLGEKVTSIGNNAFEYNQISNLTIPSSVTTIGSSAFESNQISNLTIPKTVTSLGFSAFSNNPIETLSIEECTSDISKSYFGTSIKNLTIESGEIGSSAFSSSSDSETKITNLTLGEGVTTIGVYAFQNNQISSLIIPSSVTIIGDYAFYSNQISSLYLSNATNLTAIGNRAFANNQISGELVIPASLTTIGNYAFYGNQISGELVIPSSVTTIGNGAFYDNQISGELTIPSSVTTIGNSAFYSNQISGELVIPSSVTTIGSSAFSSNQISSLTIPSSITTIEDYAFGFNQISGELVIPSSVTTIGEGAFYSNQISSIIIPKSVTEIRNNVFNGNKTLSSILIKRTEEDFLANVTTGSSWYSGSPTITYKP